jgi:predicted esterase
LVAPLVAAGEPEIVADLTAFFRTADTGERARLAARVASDPAFRRDRLTGLLHRMSLWAPVAEGRHVIQVPVGYGETRDVTLRVPRGYAPDRAWPLVYALHPSGGDGPSFIGYVEALLGPRVEEFLIAAPSHYRQTGLDAPAPFTVDHTAILRAVRRTLHVDGGRQYALGYSLGGYASWAVACLHADELAGAVPISSAFSIPPTAGGLWRAMVPNVLSLPILNVWGALDNLVVFGIEGEPLGGIADLNRPFALWVAGLLPLLTNVEIPNAGHGNARPPQPALEAILSSRRVDQPKLIEHNYRHLHQGHAYWLEASAWSGPAWGVGRPAVTPQPGESRAQALERTLAGLLGHLRGELVDQSVRVETRHVAELTIWFGDGMIDWQRPATVHVDGRAVFAGTLSPDLLLILTEAERRFDLDRLRWAGLRVREGGGAEAVTATTPFPPLVPGP